MVTTITVPNGMSALQAVHALLKDKDWQKRSSYSQEQRDDHYLLNTLNPDATLLKPELAKLAGKIKRPLNPELKAKVAQTQAAKLVYNVAIEVFSKGQFTLKEVLGKQIKVNFKNYPKLDVEGFDSMYGKGAAEKALNEYNGLPENKKIHYHFLPKGNIFDPPSPTLEKIIGIQKKKLEQSQPAQNMTQRKVQQEGKCMGYVLLATLATIATVFAGMQLNSDN